MRFSRFRLLFMILSTLTVIGLFTYTFSVNNGFAHSITFDGGIRFSLNMPAGTGLKELNAALRKSGFSEQEVSVRLANLKNNTFDLEFGPSVEDRIKKRIKTRQQAAAKKAAEARARKKGPGSAVPQKRATSNVVGEIETILLSNLKLISASDIVSREAISASYGGNLASTAVWSLLFVIGVIGLYLSFRFEVPFAIGAALALLHDVVLTVGFIGVMKVEPSIPVVAAVLTIIGYSINDTIVIFDRIRENMEDRTAVAMAPTMDLAITQTLSRTVITSLLTLLAVLALLFGGAVSLYDFALVLTFGIFIGTYSSIFIAAHFVQYYEVIRARFRR